MKDETLDLALTVDKVRTILNKVADKYLAESKDAKTDELINNMLYEVQTELGASDA